MNRYIETIFARKKHNPAALARFGFEENNGVFRRDFTLENGMLLTVSVGRRGDIAADVFDPETEEPFTLHLVESATGPFVGAVRTEYETILNDIAKRCFDSEVFKSALAKKVIAFVRETYGAELEFLWEKSPDVAVWRRPDNGKWFGVIFSLPERKLGIDSDGRAEILDLRTDADELESVLDNVRYFRAYHMNKKRWITVRLDITADEADEEEISARVRNSYALAKK